MYYTVKLADVHSSPVVIDKITEQSCAPHMSYWWVLALSPGGAFIHGTLLRTLILSSAFENEYIMRNILAMYHELRVMNFLVTTDNESRYCIHPEAPRIFVSGIDNRCCRMEYAGGIRRILSAMREVRLFTDRES